MYGPQFPPSKPRWQAPSFLKHRLQARTQGSTTVKRPLGGPENEEWTFTGPAGESRGLRLPALQQSHWANFRMQTKNLLARPLERACLSQRAPESRPTGGEGSPGRDRPHAPADPPRLAHRAAGPGVCHPTRNKRQLEPGSAAPVPAVLWSGGRGGEPSPGAGRGPAPDGRTGIRAGKRRPGGSALG